MIVQLGAKLLLSARELTPKRKLGKYNYFYAKCCLGITLIIDTIIITRYPKRKKGVQRAISVGQKVTEQKAMRRTSRMKVIYTRGVDTNVGA